MLTRAAIAGAGPGLGAAADSGPGLDAAADAGAGEVAAGPGLGAAAGEVAAGPLADDPVSCTATIQSSSANTKRQSDIHASTSSHLALPCRRCCISMPAI